MDKSTEGDTRIEKGGATPINREATMDKAYKMGWAAYEAGRAMMAPRELWPTDQLNWIDGWSEARKAHEREFWEGRSVELETKMAVGS